MTCSWSHNSCHYQEQAQRRNPLTIRSPCPLSKHTRKPTHKYIQCTHAYTHLQSYIHTYTYTHTYTHLDMTSADDRQRMECCIKKSRRLGYSPANQEKPWRQ